MQPLLYHNLLISNFCILKGECRKSQSVNGPIYKHWTILEKSTKIRSCNCICMAGVGETCNHVVTALFRVEAAVCSGLTNPSCASSANEWLLCRKDIESTKNKDLNFDTEDFAHRVKKKRPLVDSPKKTFKPLSKSNKKPLSLINFTSALEEMHQTVSFLLLFRSLKLTFFEKLLQNGLGRLM